MTGNTATGVKSQLRWDDPEATVPISETVKLLTGNPWLAHNSGGPVGATQLIVPAGNYEPVDKRSRKERRAGQRSYRLAKRYYGKTYVLTQAQAGWLVVIWLGTVMAAASGLFAWYMHVSEGVRSVMGG